MPWLVLLAGPGRSAAAEGEGPEAVVVYTLRTAEEDLAFAAQRLTDEVLIHLGKRGHRALGEAELGMMIAHATDREALSNADCTRTEVCMAKLVEVVEGAAWVVRGHLGQMGSSLLVTLTLMDAKRAVVLRGGSAVGEGEDALAEDLRRAVDERLGERGAEPRFEYAAPSRGGKIAVMALEGTDVRPGFGESIAQLVSLELKKIEGISVITKRTRSSQLWTSRSRARRASATGTSPASFEIGGALGTDTIVLTRAGRLGDTFVIHLMMLDIAEGAAVNRVSESYRGPESHLPHAVRFAVAYRPHLGPRTWSKSAIIP